MAATQKAPRAELALRFCRAVAAVPPAASTVSAVLLPVVALPSTPTVMAALEIVKTADSGEWIGAAVNGWRGGRR